MKSVKPFMANLPVDGCASIFAKKERSVKWTCGNPQIRYVVRGGEVVESFIGGAEVGVRRLLAILNSDGRDITELDADLRAGQLKPNEDQVDSWLGDVLAAIKRTLPALKRFSAVIPTGGGAVVLGQKLQHALGTKGAAVHFPDDPVIANARGFWKYGLRYA
jgi:hypothetical protein